MEYPPDSWRIFDAAEFSTATVNSPEDLGVELMAQARPNGRILDHFFFAVGGAKILEVEISMASLFNNNRYKDWSFCYQSWPKDIIIRRNMTTSAWLDVPELIRLRQAVVKDLDDQVVPIEDVAASVNSHGTGAAIRWAIVIGEDERLRLQLSALPASADVLAGKPAFRG